MKTKILIVMTVALFSVSNVIAQPENLTIKQEIDRLNKKISLETSNVLQDNGLIKKSQSVLEQKTEALQLEINKILQDNIAFNKAQLVSKEKFRKLNDAFRQYKKSNQIKINSLQKSIILNSFNIDKTANKLSIKIGHNNQAANQKIINLNKKTDKNIANLDEAVSKSLTNLKQKVDKNTLYWIIAILIIALFTLVLFSLLRKQIFKHKTDLDSNLKNTKRELEEEGVKLDKKLTEILETQLKIISSSNSGTEKEADHTLAIKVADEIIRIQKNIDRMDAKIKGLKQLKAAVKRIQDNFASNGYELVEMLGQPYNEGMKVSANFIPDEDLEEGKHIITRIIKPQVNYKGVMIQSAQIEVSQGQS